MIDRNKIFEFVKLKGPVIPRDVVKEVGGDTFLTGAFLSQMVDAKEIKISHAKIGGSPVYYVFGQEEKLSILYKYLPQKEKEAFDSLKNGKVLRDSTQEPAIRVALRSIKDFAKPLEVTIGEAKETFWKYYMIKNDEAEAIIKKAYTLVEEKETKEEKLEKTIMPQEKIEEIKKAEETTKKEEIIEPQQREQTQTKEAKKTDETIKKAKKEETQQKIIKITSEEDTTELYSKVKADFLSKGIDIIEIKTIRKNLEIDLIIKLPSVAGKLNYFCKVKDKKKNTDKDLSSVYVEGLMKKMPILYVTTGEMTKKALEMLETEFKIISIMKI
jgi:hypothetical protein